MNFFSLAQPKVPPPLQIPPSRARRQFALRLAQRKAQLESTRDQEDDPEQESDLAKAQEQEEREGHQRFARMFEGIDDSSDDESLNSYEGEDEHGAGAGGAGVGRIEVEGKEVGRKESADEEEKKEGESTKMVV
jgi:SIT4-associating protein SAP185/190